MSASPRALHVSHAALNREKNRMSLSTVEREPTVPVEGFGSMPCSPRLPPRKHVDRQHFLRPNSNLDNPMRSAREPTWAIVEELLTSSKRASRMTSGQSSQPSEEPSRVPDELPPIASARGDAFLQRLDEKTVRLQREQLGAADVASARLVDLLRAESLAAAEEKSRRRRAQAERPHFHPVDIVPCLENHRAPPAAAAPLSARELDQLRPYHHRLAIDVAHAQVLTVADIYRKRRDCAQPLRA